MAKRRDTLELESMLTRDTREKRIYGCEEVTIGFWCKGLGDEHVDFMTMDSKGIIKCYEIKVTMEDLKSSAKKSFYGHYNYLVVTRNLYNKILKSEINLEDYGVPKSVGIMVGNVNEDGEVGRWTVFDSVRKAKKQSLDYETESMLKESLIRSLYWKMEKYKSYSDGSAIKAMKKEVAEYKRNYENEHNRRKQMSNAIYGIRSILYKIYGVSFHPYEDFTSQEWADEIIQFVKNLKLKNLI